MSVLNQTIYNSFVCMEYSPYQFFRLYSLLTVHQLIKAVTHAAKGTLCP